MKKSGVEKFFGDLILNKILNFRAYVHGEDIVPHKRQVQTVGVECGSLVEQCGCVREGVVDTEVNYYNLQIPGIPCVRVEEGGELSDRSSVDSDKMNCCCKCNVC